jgi:hypothetical protein
LLLYIEAFYSGRRGCPGIEISGKLAGKLLKKLVELFREGKVYNKEEVQSLDHDYLYLSTDIVNMYSIYDNEKNEGFVSVGSSKETNKMACHAIRE